MEVYRSDVAEISLVGSMLALNSNGLLLPWNTTDKELKGFQLLDLNVERLNDKHTALGNLILANDFGALVSSLISKESKERIEEVLDVEVAQREYQGFKTLGSIGVATNKGALMHPDLTDEDLEDIESILKVEVDIGTVNRGIGYVRTGLVANSKGALIGKNTTSPEIARIEDALELL